MRRRRRRRRSRRRASVQIGLFNLFEMTRTARACLSSDYRTEAAAMLGAPSKRAAALMRTSYKAEDDSRTQTTAAGVWPHVMLCMRVRCKCASSACVRSKHLRQLREARVFKPVMRERRPSGHFMRCTVQFEPLRSAAATAAAAVTEHKTPERVVRAAAAVHQ